MRCLLFLVFSLALAISSKAQYHIQYKYESYAKIDGVYEPYMPAVSEHIYQDYFIANGQYKSIIAGADNLMELYNADKNEKTFIDIQGEIRSIKAIQENSKMTLKSITRMDSTATILGYPCKRIKIEYQNYTLEYFYSDQIKIDPKSFAQHTYVDWNRVVDAMDGSVPLQFTVVSESRKYVATAISINKFDKKIESFSPKNALKIHEKEMEGKFQRVIEPLLENQKKSVVVKSFEGSGYAMMKNFKIPLVVKFKNAPPSLLMTMSLNDIHFYIGFTDEEQWEYNPIEGKVKVKNVQSKKSNDDNLIGGINPLLKTDWRIYNPLSVKENDDSYFLLLRKDKDLEQYFINKNTFVVSKWGNTQSNYQLEDYKFIENTPFPGHLVQYNIGDNTPVFEAFFENVHYNKHYPDSLFEVPSELRDKIVYETTIEKLSDKDYYDRAEEFSKNGNYDSAISNYKHAIALNSGNKVYLNQLGLAYVKQKKYYKGIALFSEAIEMDANYSTAIGNLGFCKMSLGDYEEAIEDFSRAIKLDSLSKDHFTNRGSSYYHMEEYASASSDFQRAINIDSTSAVVYWNFAMSRYNLEDYEKALSAFTKAIEKGHNEGAVFNYRGVCFYNLEDYEAALIDFKKAVSFDNAQVNYFNNLIVRKHTTKLH